MEQTTQFEDIEPVEEEELAEFALLIDLPD